MTKGRDTFCKWIFLIEMMDLFAYREMLKSKRSYSHIDIEYSSMLGHGEEQVGDATQLAALGKKKKRTFIIDGAESELEIEPCEHDTKQSKQMKGETRVLTSLHAIGYLSLLVLHSPLPLRQLLHMDVTPL